MLQFSKLGRGKPAKRAARLTALGRGNCFVRHYTRRPAPSFLLAVAAEATSAQRTYFLLAIKLQHRSLQEKQQSLNRQKSEANIKAAHIYKKTTVNVRYPFI